MPDLPSALAQARELFDRGEVERAEELVARLAREHPGDPTTLNFRAYLLYRRGRLEEAIAAYRGLGELEPRSAHHAANLGLICFKAGRYLEAQAAFERLLALQPGDPKGLRSLGCCHERLQNLEKALDCFTRAGDEAGAERVRVRIGKLRGQAGAGGEAAHAPAPAQEPDLAAWLEGASLPPAGTGRDWVRAGSEGLVRRIREKVFVNPLYCAGHRGVVVFAPAFRDAGKAAAKFGDRRGVLARAEGNGELILTGRGRGLHPVRLGGGRVFVNYPALALWGTGIEASFVYDGCVKQAFLAAALSGAGPLVLAVSGAPVVLPVPADLPTLVRPEAVVAWTEDLAYEEETVPELRKLLGGREALRYRFEGRGYLVLQSC